MKNTIAIVLFSLLYLAGMGQETPKKKGKEPPLPEFIKKDIAGYKKEGDPKRWPVITRYTYKGKYVYYFRMPCCDQVNSVWNSKGKCLGNPDGGIMGKPVNDPLPDFNAKKKDPKQVWPEEEN